MPKNCACTRRSQAPPEIAVRRSPLSAWEKSSQRAPFQSHATCCCSKKRRRRPCSLAPCFEQKREGFSPSSSKAVGFGQSLLLFLPSFFFFFFSASVRPHSTLAFVSEPSGLHALRFSPERSDAWSFPESPKFRRTPSPRLAAEPRLLLLLLPLQSAEARTGGGSSSLA